MEIEATSNHKAMATPDLFTKPLPRFDGADYVPTRDDLRLGKQLRKIYDLMKDGEWRTLQSISDITGEPPASASSQLRHLRKSRFGSHTVNRRYEGNGLYSYQLIVKR